MAMPRRLIRFPGVSFLGFLLLCPSLVAQGLQPVVRGSVKLRGQTVLDQRVEVILLTSDGRPRDRVFTDSLGNFQFLSVGPGNYILVIDHPGYNRVEERVEITGGINRALTQRAFMLEPKPGATVQPAGVISADRLRMPKEAREALEKGERELTKRNYERAAQYLDLAIQLAPEFAEPHYLRGLASLQQNQLTEARGNFEKAAVIQPDHAETQIGLGAAFSREGNAAAAVAPLTRGLALAPKSYLGLFERCRAYLNLNQLEAALADCDAAKESDSKSHPELLVLRGNLFLQLNRAPEALREFQNYLKQDSSSPTAEAVRSMIEKMKKAGIKPAA